jgi:hypothetical protein
MEMSDEFKKRVISETPTRILIQEMENRGYRTFLAEQVKMLGASEMFSGTEIADRKDLDTPSVWLRLLNKIGERLAQSPALITTKRDGPHGEVIHDAMLTVIIPEGSKLE